MHQTTQALVSHQVTRTLSYTLSKRSLGYAMSNSNLVSCQVTKSLDYAPRKWSLATHQAIQTLGCAKQLETLVIHQVNRALITQQTIQIMVSRQKHPNFWWCTKQKKPCLWIESWFHAKQLESLIMYEANEALVICPSNSNFGFMPCKSSLSYVQVTLA